MGRISSILARSREVTADREALEDYISVVKKGVVRTDDGEMSDDDFEKYIEQIRKSKRN